MLRLPWPFPQLGGSRCRSQACHARCYHDRVGHRPARTLVCSVTLSAPVSFGELSSTSKSNRAPRQRSSRRPAHTSTPHDTDQCRDSRADRRSNSHPNNRSFHGLCQPIRGLMLTNNSYASTVTSSPAARAARHALRSFKRPRRRLYYSLIHRVGPKAEPGTGSRDSDVSTRRKRRWLVDGPSSIRYAQKNGSIAMPGEVSEGSSPSSPTGAPACTRPPSGC